MRLSSGWKRLTRSATLNLRISKLDVDSSPSVTIHGLWISSIASDCLNSSCNQFLARRSASQASVIISKRYRARRIECHMPNRAHRKLAINGVVGDDWLRRRQDIAKGTEEDC